jgi:hypothetical protein
MGAPTPSDGKSSHSRDLSDHRPSLNTQQPDPNSHIAIKSAPKSVLKKRSADEHTALLASQQREAAAAGQEDEGDYFGDLDDEDNWGESKSTWYMILLTLAIGGYVRILFNGPDGRSIAPHILILLAVFKSVGLSNSPTALLTC